MSERGIGCVEPGSSIMVEPEPTPESTIAPKEVKRMTLARVGKEAPDFVAPAFKGAGFTKVKLSDFRGKWVMLCFYPGDFTFV